MAAIRIEPAALAVMIDHAKREAPNECCGLLVAEAGAVVEAVPTRNESASPTRYRVDSREHFALIRSLRGSQRTIAGAYHSHPASAAVPSPTDVAEAWDSELLYVIVSLQDAANPDVLAYRIRDGSVFPVPLHVTAGPQ